jgi:hypothetical protein
MAPGAKLGFELRTYYCLLTVLGVLPERPAPLSSAGLALPGDEELRTPQLSGMTIPLIPSALLRVQDFGQTQAYS